MGTAPALEQACTSYNTVSGANAVEPLLLISYFINDFLCIHPFNDGNGRMSRLLTTLLLYRSGFPIGRYISLEAQIERSKDSYYEALRLSQENWHQGTEDARPFVNYLLGTILAAYHAFTNRAKLLTQNSTALTMVRTATEQCIGPFTKRTICELCPTLSLSSVEGALRRLVKSNFLKRMGVGRQTVYLRLH